MKAREETNQNV